MPTIKIKCCDRRAYESESRPDGWLTELHHENTKLSAHSASAHLERVEAFAQQADGDDAALTIYPNRPSVPVPRSRGWWGIDALIHRRRTHRVFGGKPMSFQAVSRIIHNSMGITDPRRRSLRATPSAGALYPLELRLAALNVRGLKQGIYSYLPYDSMLERLTEDIDHELLADASLHRQLVVQCGMVLGIFANWGRMIAKYGDRGYRFALLEAGHAAQNILLTCTASRLVAVPIGGFLDDEIETVFDAASPAQRVLYLIIVGSCGSGRGDARLSGHTIGAVGGIEKGR